MGHRDVIQVCKRYNHILAQLQLEDDPVRKQQLQTLIKKYDIVFGVNDKTKMCKLKYVNGIKLKDIACQHYLSMRRVSYILSGGLTEIAKYAKYLEVPHDDNL